MRARLCESSASSSSGAACWHQRSSQFARPPRRSTSSRSFRAGAVGCFIGRRGLAELEQASPGRSPARLLSFSEQGDSQSRVDGEQKLLSRAQFKVLRHLLDRPGCLDRLDRARADRALGTHHAENSSIIRVHVHGIRRARRSSQAASLESDSSRAEGYRFNDQGLAIAPYVTAERWRNTMGGSMKGVALVHSSGRLSSGARAPEDATPR